jgi:hypothetical protein
MPAKSGRGLRGHDRQQNALRDRRGGAYDSSGASRAFESDEAQKTGHQREQGGADIRQGAGSPRTTTHLRRDAAQQAIEPDLPEGLLRPRMPPYDKDTGRKPK